MTVRTRPDHSSAWAVVGVLFLFAPVVVPVLVLLAVCVFVLVGIVVQAFGDGLATGLAALGAVVGLPSLGLIGLSGAMRVVAPKPIPTSAAVRESSDARSRRDSESRR